MTSENKKSYLSRRAFLGHPQLVLVRQPLVAPMALCARHSHKAPHLLRVIKLAGADGCVSVANFGRAQERLV